MRYKHWTAITAALLATGCANTGVAGNNATGSTQSAAPTTQDTGAARVTGGFHVGLVTDTGGLNDHGFNHLSYMGVQRAEQQLGVAGSVVQSRSSSDYVPNLSRYAREGYNLVIAVGYLMDSAVKQVAKEYPKTRFLIIDDAITGQKNVTSAIFKTEQCGYLVGAMAGLLEKASALKGMNKQNVVGVVGGMSIPPVNTYIAGFQQGVSRTDPGAKVILKYANSFSDQALGSQFAQNEIASGADILFQVAGGLGIGVIDAAQSANVYAIGADADQNYLAKNTVITSALKGVDTATYDVIAATKSNKFKPGIVYFDLANKGVGITNPIPAVPQNIALQVNRLAVQLKAGKIKVSDVVKGSR